MKNAKMIIDKDFKISKVDPRIYDKKLFQLFIPFKIAIAAKEGFIIGRINLKKIPQCVFNIITSSRNSFY